MTVQYQSSKGPMAIETMPTPYMRNALAKLQREADPARAAEIEAMAAQLAEREEQESEAPPPAGHNNPPEETPVMVVVSDTWGAIKANLDDTLTEARNWADGAPIENQQQADTVARLVGDLKAAADSAEDARKAEKKPLDEQIAAIQDRYNAYIAPIKNAVPGSVTKAVAALNNAQTAWLLKLDEAREAEAKRVRDAAAAELAKAQAAIKEASASSDLAARDHAEEIFGSAKALDKEASRLETTKVASFGGSRATTLRDNWVAAIAVPVQALRWAWAAYPARLEALALELAQAEVRAGKRAIDGFTITNERRV